MFEGIAELIAAAAGRSGLAWGVVTNKSMRFTEPLTRRMPLVCHGRRPSSAATARRTRSRIRRRCWRRPGSCGVAPARCIYVGDDERDVVAGRAAGMGTVAATYGYLGSNADTQLWGAHAAFHRRSIYCRS